MKHDCQPIALYLALFLVVVGCICNWCKIIKQSREIQRLKMELTEARPERIRIDTNAVNAEFVDIWDKNIQNLEDYAD